MQGHGRGGWILETRSQQTSQYCDHGSTSSVREIYEQITEGN
jgi:hypothetical protein